MTVRELLSQVRDTLQDTNGTYWSESELLNYCNSGIRAIASESLEKSTTSIVSLAETTNEYTIDGVLRYISAKNNNDKSLALYADDGSGDEDLNGIIVMDRNRIYVNDPSDDVTLTIKYVPMPEDQNLNDNIRPGEENALREFVIYKAYEKESEMQNYQKSSDYMSKFRQELHMIKKNSKLGFIKQVETTKGYYY